MLLILLLLVPLHCFASVNVAFIEIRTPEGKLIQLEKDGQFSHIAISYKDKWLHTHPYRGVELITKTELLKIGTTVIINLPKQKELTVSTLKTFLGKPYDSEFSWTNESFYCSELVGKILKIRPKPMGFDSNYWLNNQKLPRTEVGLSPDDIYTILSNF